MLLTGEVVANCWEFGLNRLVKETSEGKIESFERLFCICVPHISSFLSSRFFEELDPHEIDSLVMETMVRVWQKGASCTANTDKQARNWVLTIANNLALDLIRTKIRAREIEVELDYERLPEGEPEERNDHYGRDLIKFFERLTSREMEVAKLLAEGYRDVDVAEELGISKTRVHQFKEQIKEKAEGFFDSN